MRELTISIVNWNTRDELAACLHSIEPEVRDLDCEVVVVDNASGDGSVEMVREAFPWATGIGRDVNGGFADGNNVAIRHAPARYYLILNPDIEVLPGSIRKLIAFLERTPDAAAVGPLLVGMDDAPQPHFYRRFPTRMQILFFYTFFALIGFRLRSLVERFLAYKLEGDAPTPVDQIPGAAMLIRDEALRDIGLMDPDYFIWFEDVDWCYRAQRNGWKVYALPGVRMRHEGGVSFELWEVETRIFQFYRAFFRFLCKFRKDRLIRFALPLLSADLRLRGLPYRFHRFMHPTKVPDLVRMEQAVAAIQHVVARYRRGEIVAFDGAKPVPLPDDAAHAPPPVEPAPAADPAAVDVVIVNWNDRPLLDRCLEAVRASRVPVNTVVVDNGSDDGSVAYLRDAHPDIHMIALARNIGYAEAANAGLRATSQRYALVMNPDVQLEPGYLDTLVRRMDADPDIGAAQGKLYRMSRDDFTAGRPPERRVLDSAGHVIRRTRRVMDRGEGQEDDGRWDEECSVFSACGAALLLRRTMLEELSPEGEWFDRAFFAYKEDIDLCWRARLLGWDIRYVPDAVAHHVRGWAGTGSPPGRRLPATARRHSWKNHYLLILKNDRLRDLLRSLPWVAGWELVRQGYALLRDPAVYPAYATLLRTVPHALRERRATLSRRRASGRDLARWFIRDAVPVADTARERPEIGARAAP